jgi:CSLREA domain-containing protein
MARSQRHGRPWKAILALTALAIAVLILAPQAFAGNFTVDSNNDGADPDVGDGTCAAVGGGCTLRAAIQEANANAPQPDTINLSGISGQILLTSALPTITDSATINGPGADQLAVDGAGSYRVIDAQIGPTTISNLTVTHGQGPLAGQNAFAGGIQSAGTLTLDHVVVTQNNALASDTSFGGGIYVGGGTLTLTHSTVSNNNSTVMRTGSGNVNAYGGGVYVVNGATLMLDHSTVSGNYASTTVTSPTSPSNAAGRGGGIYSDGSTQVDQSTISGNVAGATGASDSDTATGGGLSEGNGPLAVTGSTFSDNSVSASGAPSLNADGANLATGLSGGTFKSSIVANPVGASSHNCILGVSLTSNGYNLDEDDSCGLNQPTDLTGDPMLGPLANNGGPTQTMRLLAGSPAIDKGKSFGATTDQRGAGFPRISDSATIANADGGDGADIGAFERDVVAPHNPAILTSIPKSPANNNHPKLKGLAEAGSIIRIYTTAGCTGSPVKAGQASTFTTTGLPVTVADNTATTFRATATDAANNTSTCSPSFTYVEDSAPPNTTITSATISPAKHRAVFSFSSTEAGSTFRCRLDAQAYTNCASPKGYTGLAAGHHTFSVRAKDKAGNVDPTPATRGFTL